MASRSSESPSDGTNSRTTGSTFRRPSGLSPLTLPLRPSPPRRPAAVPDLGSARSAKRRWEEVEDDDIHIGEAGSVAGSEASRSSYNTRRKNVWRANHRASQRSSARYRHKPIFNYIDVEECEDFYRHYRAGFTFAKPDPLIVEFVEERGTPAPNCKPEEVCFLTACDDVQMNHLKYFDRPPRELNPRYRTHYNNALRAVSSMLALDTKLAFPHSEDLEEVSFKAKKFPGAYYRKSGFANRGEAQETALVDARLAFATLMDGQHVEPHNVRLGGRGKSVLKSESKVKEEGEPKGRLILMLSQRDLLLCGVTEQQLTAAYCSDAYPLSVGMGWFKRNVTRFAERYAGAEKYFCFDAEKFDSSIDPYMIRDAIDILRGQYQHGDSVDYDSYWQFVMESLITAPIQRDDGWVMHKSVGTTSGHNHNTLLQSICTLLIGYTAFLAAHPDIAPKAIIDDMALESLGDDNLASSAGLCKGDDADSVGVIVLDAFGISWLGDKSFATTRLMDDVPSNIGFTEVNKFQGIQYLGKYLRTVLIQGQNGMITTALPYRPVLETFVHMYYPERRGNSADRTYQRALGNLLDNYGNPLAARWLNDLLDWLEPKLDLLPEDWLEDTIQDAARNYTATEVRVPKPMRWSWEEWVALCLTTNDRDDEWFCNA